MIGAMGVYRAAVTLQERDGRITIPALCIATGLVSKDTVYKHLWRLRSRGLVTGDLGRAGTIRLVARPVTYARLLTIEAT